MKKLLSTLLVLSMGFGMLVGVKANQGMINSISVNKNDMVHSLWWELVY